MTASAKASDAGVRSVAASGRPASSGAVYSGLPTRQRASRPGPRGTWNESQSMRVTSALPVTMTLLSLRSPAQQPTWCTAASAAARLRPAASR